MPGRGRGQRRQEDPVEPGHPHDNPARIVYAIQAQSRIQREVNIEKVLKQRLTKPLPIDKPWDITSWLRNFDETMESIMKVNPENEPEDADAAVPVSKMYHLLLQRLGPLVPDKDRPALIDWMENANGHEFQWVSDEGTAQQVRQNPARYHPQGEDGHYVALLHPPDTEILQPPN